VSVCAWRKDAPALASIIPDRRNIKDKRRSWWQACSFRTLTGDPLHDGGSLTSHSRTAAFCQRLDAERLSILNCNRRLA
jgi:hypothetical protein